MASRITALLYTHSSAVRSCGATSVEGAAMSNDAMCYAGASALALHYTLTHMTNPDTYPKSRTRQSPF